MLYNAIVGLTVRDNLHSSHTQYYKMSARELKYCTCNKAERMLGYSLTNAQIIYH